MIESGIVHDWIWRISISSAHKLSLHWEEEHLTWNPRIIASAADATRTSDYGDLSHFMNYTNFNLILESFQSGVRSASTVTSRHLWWWIPQLFNWTWRYEPISSNVIVYIGMVLCSSRHCSGLAISLAFFTYHILNRITCLRCTTKP